MQLNTVLLFPQQEVLPLEPEEGGPSEGSSVVDDGEGALTIDLDACPKSLPAKARTSERFKCFFCIFSSNFYFLDSILKAVQGLASKNRAPSGRSRGRPRSSGITRAMTTPEGQESSAAAGQSSLERRGRGRPRLKPYGPANQGSRKRKKASGSLDNSFEGEVTLDQLNPSISCT